MNPAPVTITLEIVTLALPLFVIEVVFWLLLWSSTLPKARVVGLAPSNRLVA